MILLDTSREGDRIFILIEVLDQKILVLNLFLMYIAVTFSSNRNSQFSWLLIKIKHLGVILGMPRIILSDKCAKKIHLYVQFIVVLTLFSWIFLMFFLCGSNFDYSVLGNFLSNKHNTMQIFCYIMFLTSLGYPLMSCFYLLQGPLQVLYA